MASTTEPESSTESSGESSSSGRRPSEAAYRSIVERVRSPDEACRLEAAREIRRLTKTSSRNRRHLSDAIEPLVSMLQSGGVEATESALLALLNLAVKDERNKIRIMDAGALVLLIGFLKSKDSTLQEYATAAILTLTASANKSEICSAGTIPLLFDILRDGNTQAQTDAITALHNLSKLPESIKSILSLQPIPPLIGFLKNCEKSSTTAEKVSALLECLLDFQEGRDSLMAEEGGILTVVELLEEGSLRSKEHVIGALLTMCRTDRCKYREVILNVGAIPGLLELTVRGTFSSQAKARELLQLLRDSSGKRPELQSDAIENIVSTIIARIEDEDHVEKAKKILAEMIQVSMEQSWKHLQQRALGCTPSKLSHETNQTPEIGRRKHKIPRLGSPSEIQPIVIVPARTVKDVSDTEMADKKQPPLVPVELHRVEVHRFTLEGNPTFQRSLKEMNILGFQRLPCSKVAELKSFEIDHEYMREAIKGVFTDVLKIRYLHDACMHSSEITAEIAEIAPIVADMCISALYAKLRMINRHYGKHSSRYASVPLYSKDVALPLPFALAIQDLGSFQTHSMEKNFTYIPTYIEGVTNEGRVEQTCKAVEYLSYSSTLLRLGIEMKTVDPHIKTGTPWWTYKVDNLYETTDLVCTLPQSHYTDHNAILRSIFLCPNKEKICKDIIKFDKDATVYGTMITRATPGFNARSFCALIHGPEEEWSFGTS